MSTIAVGAPSLFSSLPYQIVLYVLAHVPRRYHPILCCVSKSFRSLITSAELQKSRSLLGKDCFYVCFQECGLSSLTYRWFTLTENHRLVSIPFPTPPEPYSTALMVGHEIYFVGGSLDKPSRTMSILDTRSGELHQSPSVLVASCSPAVGLVDGKIYMFGGFCNEKIQAQVFDPKTQTWGVAVNPSVEVKSRWMSIVSPSLDKKIYARDRDGKDIIVYDSRDGKCEIIKLPARFHYKNLCVIGNVLYVHYNDVGLMWYNSTKKEWKVVPGLKTFNFSDINVVMSEYYGKLAFVWHEKEKMEIWCAMIALRWSGVAEVQGRVDWSSCLHSDVPSNYYIMHCLCRTD